MLTLRSASSARGASRRARGTALEWLALTCLGVGKSHAQARMHYLFLTIAIVSEVVATSALKASSGFTRLGPSLVVMIGYASAFYFLSLALRSIPVGVAYAIWSGVGIALVSIVAWFLFDQRLDLPAIVGMSLIAAGVLTLYFFSKTAAH